MCLKPLSHLSTKTPNVADHAALFNSKWWLCASTLPTRNFSGSISEMKKNKSADPLRPHSSLLLDGNERVAMLYPVGFTKEDFAKPIIGIASTWSNVTTQG